MESIQYQPSGPLKPFIERFIISEVAAENVYKVLPGTGVVMGFQFQGRLYHVKDGNPLELSRSGITGLNDTYKLFKNSNGIGTVLVYFKEGGASPFFQEPIHELFGSSVSLDNFLLRSELLVFEERLSEAVTYLQKIEVVEEFLLLRMRPFNSDPMVMQALDLIFKRKGDIRISELLRQLNISQSPLEKRFRRIVGASPKKFASIVRFRNIIRNATLPASLTAVGYDAGFYDQSHFIKEFRKFSGDTPEEYFNAR